MTTLTCPFCRDPDAQVTMSLTDSARVCECGGCGEAFTPAEAVRALTVQLDAWQAVAEWADAFPVGRPKVARKTA
jgi:transcription elongation factor Elf1